MPKTLKSLLDSNKFLVFAILILTFSVNIAYNLTSGSFGPFAANLARTHRHYAHIFSINGFEGLISEGLPVYNWLYPLFLALANTIFGHHSQAAVLFIQFFFLATAAYALYQLTKELFDHNTALLSALTFIMTWHIFRWANFLLTDSLNILLIILCLTCLTFYTTRKDIRFLIPLTVIVLMLLLLMHTNILLALIVAIYLLFIGRLINKPLPSILAGTLILLVIIIALVTVDPASPSSPSSYLNSYSGSLQRGEIIAGIPGYNIPIKETINAEDQTGGPGGPGGPFFYTRVIAKRALYFWSFYLEPHSTFHRLFNLAWLGPLYLFGLIGLCKSLKGSATNKYINRLLIIFIFGYTLFHALTYIDYDQIFRAPILAVVIIYTSHGIVSFCRKLMVLRKQTV